MTDNGACYRSQLFAAALKEAKHRRTRPYRPPLTGQSLHDLAVILPNEIGKLEWTASACCRRVALTGAGQIPLLMSHA